MTYAELKALNPVGGDCVQLDCEACTVCGLSMECNPCYSINHARLVTDKVREIVGAGVEPKSTWVNSLMMNELERIDPRKMVDTWVFTATPAEITLAALLALAKWREENAE